MQDCAKMSVIRVLKVAHKSKMMQQWIADEIYMYM